MLKRQLFFFETPEDGGGSLPPSDATPPPEEVPWSVTKDEWDTVVNYLAQTRPLMEFAAKGYMAEQESAAPPAEQNPLPPRQDEGFDPWDPDSVQRFIASQIESGIGQHLAPYQHVMNQVAMEEGERAAQAQLDELAQSLGTDGEPAAFDRELAIMIAAGHMADPQADPTMALQHGVNFAIELERKIREDERSKLQSGFNELAQNPNELPVVGSARETAEIPTGPDRYRIAIERGLANRRAAQAGGI